MGAQVVDGEVLNAAAAERLPLDDPQTKRVIARCTRESAALVKRVDVVHDDPRITELRPAQHHLQAVDERTVAAPVRGKGLLVASRLLLPSDR